MIQCISSEILLRTSEKEKSNKCPFIPCTFRCSRGELYMFVAQSGKPVLIGLLAGSAANIAMDVDIRDEEVRERERDDRMSD